MTVYLPSFLFAVGQGAIVPIVALTARDLGASLVVAGLVVAVRGFGTLLFDLPAGSLVARFGERRAMGVGTALLAVSLVAAAASPSVPLFAGSIFLMGCAWAVWLLARLAYVSDVMPVHLRGRALSTLGGTMRVGTFTGPFMGAAAVGAAGLDAAYWMAAALAAVGYGVLLFVPAPHQTTAPARHGTVRLRALGHDHRSTLATAGFGALCIGLLRASRQAVLPLWADQVGIGAAAVQVIFGISSGMDMLLFYPAGSISDRFGRKYVAVPCMSILALGFLLMPAAHSFWSLVLVGLVLGFGNGLGSGIVMTLGADFSPSVGRAEFLGLWRVIGDIGTAGGPLLAAGVTAAAGLAPAAFVTGGLGLTGALVVLLRMPEPLHRTHQPTADQVRGVIT